MYKVRIDYFILLFVVALFFAGCANSSTNSKNGSTTWEEGETISANNNSLGEAEITFSENEYVFGSVKKGKEISHIFEYTNTGNAPLIINDVIASCGCTVPSFSTEPVYAGEKGTVKVTFDTKGYKGLQTKTITVKSNAKNSTVLLRIIAQIQ